MYDMSIISLCAEYIGRLTHAQDFEGQRLAEMLSTVLLGAAGVRFNFPLRVSLLRLTGVDSGLCHRLHTTRYPSRPLHWPRRHRPHISRSRSTVALLQQEPRGLASRAQRFSGELQHQRGWPEGWISGTRKAWQTTVMDQCNIMTVTGGSFIRRPCRQ